MSGFAIRNIKAILFVTVALCLVGAWIVGTMPVSILPDITFPRIVIIAEAGERPSRMMEVAVTRRLEEAVATVPGIRRIRSKTQRGASELSVDLAWGSDMLLALQLITTRVNEVRPELPPETRISVERMNPTIFPIYGLSVGAPGLNQSDLWSLATYTIRPRLLRVAGVSRVVVQGGRIPEIAIEADPQRLAAYRLSLADIEQAVSQTNIVSAVGRIDFRFQQYQAIVSGEIEDARRLGEIVVAQRGGQPIYLRQVAGIREATQDRLTVETAGGRESVLLNIFRQPEANTIAVIDEMRSALAELKSSLPPGTKIGVWYDQSTLIRDAVNSVRDAVLIGAVLAVFVLLLFLGDLRATLVTAAIIPMTVLITLLLMRLSGLTINLMTLGALAVGIGLVIDDAIVVVENIVRHLARGQFRTEAVRFASAEIAAPMVSSTLTTVVVFLPLVLVAGVAGAFFTALALTLVIALMVSLALALAVSPSLCAGFLRAEVAKEHGRLFERFVQVYGSTLRFLLRHPRAAYLSLGVIVALTLLIGMRMQTGFMPEMDEGAFVLDFWTPPGTSLTESDRILNQIERILHETPEVAAYSRRTGTEMGFFITEPNRGDMAITLKRRRARKIDEVIDGIRERIGKEVPGAEVEFVQVLQDLIGDLAGSPEPIEIKLFGEDQELLNAAARGLAGKLEKLSGFVDVKSGLVESGPELIVRVDPARAGRAGLTPSAVADQVNAALLGHVPTLILRGDRQVPVRVRFPERFRSDPASLATVPIRAPSGFYLPLTALGVIDTVPGTVELNREDQRKMVAVTARLSGRDLGSAIADVSRIMRRNELPRGITYILGGQFRSQTESFQSLLLVLGLAVLLVFAVMLFQFGSFTAPTVIVLLMPLSLFGVVLGLWLTHTPFNVSSFMGAIMLVGIVVKNGILLLDRAQRDDIRGVPLEEAVLEAGQVRLRPILMTTLTAILGLAPLSLGLGAGAEMQKPLAIAVMGGLTFSTLFTLLFAPLLYVSLRRRQRRPDTVAGPS